MSSNTVDTNGAAEMFKVQFRQISLGGSRINPRCCPIVLLLRSRVYAKIRTVKNMIVSVNILAVFNHAQTFIFVTINLYLPLCSFLYFTLFISPSTGYFPPCSPGFGWNALSFAVKTRICISDSSNIKVPPTGVVYNPFDKA